MKCSTDFLRELLCNPQRQGNFIYFGGRYTKEHPENWEAMRSSVCTVIDVQCKGKFSWWELENSRGERWFLHCTYGMSGGWFTELSKHRACTFRFLSASNESCDLHFNDARRFGTLKFTQEAEHYKKLASLGPSILSEPPLTSEVFAHRLRKKPHLNITQALLNQSLISGIGNYLKTEALYAARLSPHHVVSSLSEDEMSALYEACLSISLASYRAKGATLRDYKQPTGEEGQHQFELKVYNRSTDDAGNKIVSEETLDGRTTWWVPELQR